MIETKAKQIGIWTFSVTQFGARDGLHVANRLGKVLGPTIGEALSAGDAGELAIVGKAIGALTQRIDDAELDWLLDKLMAQTHVSNGLLEPGKSPLLSSAGMFDLVFGGQYGLLMRWVAFALETNFADFFAEVAGLRAKVLVPPASAETVPSESK